MDRIRDLIDPLRKKYVYHFIVSPTTSLIEKPEWYLGQTLKLINKHINSLDSTSRYDNEDSDLRFVFVSSVLEMAMQRLRRDMKTIKSELTKPQSERYKAILVHNYNEVQNFMRSVRQLLGHESFAKLDDDHDLMSEFYDSDLFELIVNVEWDYAKQNLRDITTAGNRWDFVLDGDYVDLYKIPKCVDRLLLLVKSIHERAELFSEVNCQFKLIELQCHILNKFLVFLDRSSQSIPVNKNIISDILFLRDDSTIDISKMIKILNGVDFLRLVIKEKHFLSQRAIEQLDLSLQAKSEKLEMDYRTLSDRLITEIISVFDYVECDLYQFLNFVKPKMSCHIYELVRDEATRRDQLKRSKDLFL